MSWTQPHFLVTRMSEKIKSLCSSSAACCPFALNFIIEGLGAHVDYFWSFLILLKRVKFSSSILDLLQNFSLF